MAVKLCLQLATLIAVYASWDFARIEGIGWGWAGAIWLFSIITYLPLDVLKFIIRYALSGRAWDNLFQTHVTNSTSIIAICYIPLHQLTVIYIYISPVADRILDQEGLRKGWEGGTVGAGSEDAARAEERGCAVPGQELPGVVGARWASKETSRGRKDDRTGLKISTLGMHSPCNYDEMVSTLKSPKRQSM